MQAAEAVEVMLEMEEMEAKAVEEAAAQQVEQQEMVVQEELL
jgi:hypothetical protein